MTRAATALAGGLLAVLLGSPPLAALPRVELASESVHVPFEYRNHLITVLAKVNGAGPFRFLVDTGATLAVTPAVAKAAQLTTTTEPVRLEGNGPGTEMAAGVAPVSRIDVGGVSIYDATTLVFDQSVDDGIIGYPLFAALRVTIDFAGRGLDFRSASDTSPLPGRVVPMLISNGHFPMVRASIQGDPGLVRVDTGASRALLVNSTFAREHHFGAYSIGYETWGTAVGGQTHETVVAPLTLAMGPLVFGRVDSTISLLSSGMSADSSAAASVGTRLLESYIVTFDYQHRQMSFDRP